MNTLSWEIINVNIRSHPHYVITRHTLICFTCLCDCLHPPSTVTHFPYYPLCIYTCVLCLSVASSSCCQFVFPALLLSL